MCVSPRAGTLVMQDGRGCLWLASLSGGLWVPVQPRVHLWPHLSAGLLILLSLTLFIANCEMLKPRPQVSYLVTTYLSWGASALMLWAGEGGVSAGQGVGPRASVPGRASDRIGVDPTGGQPTGKGRGLGGHLAAPLPPPRNPELLKLHGHVGQRDVLHGTADELPPVGLAAEHPEVHIRTAVVGRRLQARRGPVRLRACPPPPPPTSSLVQAS